MVALEKGAQFTSLPHQFVGDTRVEEEARGGFVVLGVDVETGGVGEIGHEAAVDGDVFAENVAVGGEAATELSVFA